MPSRSLILSVLMNDLDPSLRFALRAFFGTGGAEPDVGETEIVRFLVRNKAPVAAVPFDVPADRDGPVAAYAEGQAQILATAIAEYGAVHERWRARGIEGVLIKSPGYFPYTSDNLDVLVPETARDAAVEVLEECGYRELPWVREPYKLLFRKIDAEPFGFAIHLHTKVAWINRFFDGADLSARSVADADLPCLVRPSAEDAFLITAAHWFYEDKELKLRDLIHVAMLLEGDVDWNAVARVAAEQGWGRGLASATAIYRRAFDGLGLSAIGDRLPTAGFGPAPRWVDEIEAPATLPLRLPRVRTKVAHLVKSVRDPRIGVGEKVREAGLVAFYAGRVRLPDLRRQPSLRVRLTGAAAGEASFARALLHELYEGFEIRATYRGGRGETAAPVRRTLLGGVEFHAGCDAASQHGHDLDIDVGSDGRATVSETLRQVVRAFVSRPCAS
jgi:hypothetical protein